MPRLLETSRADDPVLAARAPDLDLVDVVEQRGGLHERSVHRDLRLGDETGGGHGDARHALGVDDDAVGQPGVGKHATSGGSVRNGHGPILAAGRNPCTGRGALQPRSVRSR